MRFLIVLFGVDYRHDGLPCFDSGKVIRFFLLRKNYPQPPNNLWVC